MKKIITAFIASSTLLGCASTEPQAELDYMALQQKIEHLELNQRLIASQLKMTAAMLPAEIDYVDGIQLGDKNAPYVVIEFTDLQCTYCAKFQQETFPEFKERYIDTGEVLFVARELPLSSIHPQATEAAIALRCIQQQQPSAYSQSKAKLFENSDALNTELYQSLVNEHQLDQVSFDTCLNSGEQLTAVNNAYKYAVGIGLNSTPSFIFGKNTGSSAVDYKIAKGALTMEHMNKALDVIKSSK